MRRLHRYSRNTIILLLFLIQVLFLLMVFREHTGSYMVLTAVTVVAIGVLYAYRKGRLHDVTHDVEPFKVAVWVPVGALLSYYLNRELGLGPVLGAAITGTAASLLTYLKWKPHYLQHLPPAIYCGAFVGMSQPKVAPDASFVLLAGVCAGLFMAIAKNVLKGVGGKLGTLAFLGVVIAYLLLYLLHE